MKRLCLYFSFIILSLNLCAAPVDPTTAAKVATNFYRQQTMAKTLFKQQAKPELLDVTTQTPYQHIYVFNAAEGNGFVLVAGDDRSTPVLGYSDEGRFVYDSLPDNARSWIDHYEQEIAYIIAHDAEPYTTTANEWETLRNGGLLESKGGSVAPLIKTQWNQCNPNSRSENALLYNNSCPLDNTSGIRTLTGCVATAMAQIMKYWEYPTRGAGSHWYKHPIYGTLSANFGNTTYNWSNMPNSLSTSSTTTQKNAVATLMYHCGVSVDMNYGVDFSGSNNQKAKNSLEQYFGYSPQMQYDWKSKYSETIWINSLKQELDNGRPILYQGQASTDLNAEGHSFICDGYNSNNLFHFNWGWGGSPDVDGYFIINLLNPSSNNFSYQQTGLFGIQPAGSTPPSTNYDLSMYAPLSTNASSYDFGDNVTVNFTIANYGDGIFNGQFLIILVDAQDNYPIVSYPLDMTLKSKEYISKSITFEGNEPLVPGNYYAVVYESSTPNDINSFQIIKASSSNNNVAYFKVNSLESPIETNSSYTFSSGNVLYSGKSTEITVNVLNNSTYTQYGTIEMVIANLKGKDEQSLEKFSVSTGWAANTNYKLTTTKTIEVAAGEHFLTLYFNPQGTEDWYYIGSSNYKNPVRVTVAKPALSPDSYEPNNTVAAASNLGSVASNNRTFTINANLHTASDVDYYKINLPAGYKYTITGQMNDSYNSSYTAFAEIHFSLDGTNIVGSYDNEISAITVNNGGTLYFRLNGYNSNTNDIGTYQVILYISRVSNTGIEEFEAEEMTLYPNPAIDKIYLTINKDVVIKEIELTNAMGQLLRTYPGSQREFQVGNLPSGLYFMRIVTAEGVLTRKWVK